MVFFSYPFYVFSLLFFEICVLYRWGFFSIFLCALLCSLYTLLCSLNIHLCSLCVHLCSFFVHSVVTAYEGGPALRVCGVFHIFCLCHMISYLLLLSLSSVSVSVSVVVIKLHLSLRSFLAAGALSSYMKARLELDHVISDLICTD